MTYPVALEPLTWNDKPRCQHIVMFGSGYQCSKPALDSGLCYQHDPEMSQAYRRKRGATAEKRRRLLSIRRQDAQDFKDSALKYDDAVTLIGWWELGGQAAFDRL